jgi:hypothetical protein
VYNKTIRLSKKGVGWNLISPRLQDDSDLVKNTTQRIVAKSLRLMENYYEYDGFGLPPYEERLRTCFVRTTLKRYKLSLTDDGNIVSYQREAIQTS